MHNRQRIFIWLAVVTSFVASLLFVLNGSVAGWVFFVIGISYIGMSTRAGQAWAASNPSLARWVLIGATFPLVLLVLVVGAVFLLR